MSKKISHGSGKKVSDKEVAELLASFSPQVRKLASNVRALVRTIVPDASEEVDRSTKMIVETFMPGTYKGAILAVAPQKDYVNIMFGKGVELMAIDKTGLLEGTGKLARHIKIRSEEQLKDPAVRALIDEAATRTPRSR